MGSRPLCRDRRGRGRHEPARRAGLRRRGILKPGTRIIGIDDSKKLDAAAREDLAKEIMEKAASWCVAFVEVEEIDLINIYWAGIRAMQRAVQGLGSTPQHLLIDAKRLKEIDIPQQAIIKAMPSPPASPPPPFLQKSSATRRCGCSTRVTPDTASPTTRATR